MWRDTAIRTVFVRGGTQNHSIDRADATSQVKQLEIGPFKEPRTVAKTDLGTKRLCGSCAAKFYDLGKAPIVCPKCQTVLTLAPVSTRSRPEPARAVAEEEVAAPETQEAEFVSLEEADAEAQGKKPEGEAAEGDEIELEDEPLDDAAFIEEQEEGDDDVADIIGDVEDEEEA